MFSKRSDKIEPSTRLDPVAKPSANASETSRVGELGASGRPMTSAKGTDRMAPSVIGADLTIMGNAESKGEVQIDGVIQGDIHCASLFVGESAQITGGIVAEDVVVRGRVMGSIRGMRVTLQSSSHVEGDIYHQSLAIEQGAFFEGKSRREEDPLVGAQKSNGQTRSEQSGAGTEPVTLNLSNTTPIGQAN